MKKYLIGIFCLVAVAVSSQAADILVDDFSSGSVGTDGRIFLRDIDTGWYGPNGDPTYGDHEWVIDRGVMKNSAATPGNYPQAVPAEGGLFQMVTYGSDPLKFVEISFDYSVPAGDTLYVHFWGFDGTIAPSSQFIANNQPCNGIIAITTANFTGSIAYNMKNGTPATGFATEAYLTLTGSGTHQAKISVPGFGISGVNTAGDFEYYLLGFSEDELGAPGTTSIDNVSITSTQTAGYLDLILYDK